MPPRRVRPARFSADPDDGQTLILAFTAAVLSPLLFSVLGYILVRTRWRGRAVLDSIIWGSAAFPGILSGLGLLMVILGTPVITALYGTVAILILVVILQGNTTGVNISRGSIVQVGFDMEEAARIAGAGWLRTYVRIWIPLLSRTLILLATMNFVMAAGATSSIILLASSDTITLSMLALFLAEQSEHEVAAIVAVFLMAISVGVALVTRRLGGRVGVKHEIDTVRDMKANTPSAPVLKLNGKGEQA